MARRGPPTPSRRRRRPSPCGCCPPRGAVVGESESERRSPCFDCDDSRLCSHAVKQVFVQESQLRKSTRPRLASARSLHIDPRSPSTRRRRVCSTAWRPAYALAAASCRWPRVLVLVAASARWRGGRRVRFRPVATTRTPLVAALPHLTRSCPRRGKEEDRQGAFFYLSRGRATRRACSRTRRRDARAPV